MYGRPCKAWLTSDPEWPLLLVTLGRPLTQPLAPRPEDGDFCPTGMWTKCRMQSAPRCQDPALHPLLDSRREAAPPREATPPGTL